MFGGRYTSTPPPSASTPSHEPIVRHDALATPQQLATGGQVAVFGRQLSTVSENMFDSTVEKHSVKFDESVSLAFQQAYTSLGVLRTSLKNQQGFTGGLKECDRVWQELKHINQMTSDMQKNALAFFLNKQKENFKLYHQTAIQETMRQSYVELQSHRENILLQNDVIMGQQKQLNEYHADTEAKLRELADLKEEVSQLTLNRGFLKFELSKSQFEVRELRAAAEKNTKVHADMSAKISTLLDNKSYLELEKDLVCTEADKASHEAGAKLDRVRKELDLEKTILQTAQASLVEMTAKCAEVADELARVSSLYDTEIEKYGKQIREFGFIWEERDNLKKDLKPLGKQVTDLKMQVADLNQQVTTLEKQSQVDKEKITSAVAELGELQAENASRLLQIQRLNAEREEVEKTHADEVASLSNQELELQVLVDKLEAARAELIAKNQGLMADKANASLTDNAAQADLDAVRRAKEEAELKLEETVAHAAKLDADLSQWKELAQRSVAQISRNVSDIAQAKEEKTRLVNRIRELETQSRGSI